MLHRRPACSRAVQRQLHPPSDSIWVSESLLLATYERFFAAAIPKPTRRHGSFVPGPLESRRRMGKRRMAHISDAGPYPAHAASSLWSWLGSGDRTQWRWEAPTARYPEANAAAALPGWLSNWDAEVEVDALPPSTETRAELPADLIFGTEEVLEFQQNIKGGNLVEILEICSQFNNQIRQSLAIGIVPETTLYEALSVVTSEIGKAFPDAQLAESQLLTFYQSVWEGISTCKVFKLDGLQAATMDKLLALISDLPMALDARVLAHSILTRVSTTQLEGMCSSIVSTVKAWSRSWLKKESIHANGTLLNAAREAVKCAGETVNRITVPTIAARISTRMRYRSDLALELNIPLLIHEARNALKQAECDLLSGIKVVKQAEHALFPVRSSIATLSDSLRRLSVASLNHVIQSCSDEVAATCKCAEIGQTRIRLGWLTVLAQLPSARDGVFIENWQRMEDKDWHVPDDFGSDLVLSHMVSQGYVRESTILRNAFESAPTRSALKDYGFLLFALHRHHGSLDGGARYVLGFLNQREKYYTIYKTFSTMKSLGVRIPVDVIRQALEILSKANARLAYNVYWMYIPVSCSIEQLDLSRCPNFVISMIHDDLILPENIWKVMGIPIYEEMEIHEWPGLSKEPLSPAMIDLITRMATAFSRSSARPQRVALRNIMQCLAHLRRYQAPITPELSKAVSYAGLTREVIRQNWIGTERLRWVLDVVEYAEGVEVKDTVDTAIWHWRQTLIQKQDAARNSERRSFLSRGRGI